MRSVAGTWTLDRRVMEDRWRRCRGVLGAELLVDIDVAGVCAADGKAAAPPS